jgi:hypothetical protein
MLEVIANQFLHGTWTSKMNLPVKMALTRKIHYGPKAVMDAPTSKRNA